MSQNPGVGNSLFSAKATTRITPLIKASSLHYPSWLSTYTLSPHPLPHMTTNRVDARRTAYLERTSEMAKAFMEEVFCTTPYPWQQEVISHLCCMQIPNSGSTPAPVLLVRPTGGGKSSVRDVYSIMNGGFSLTITPLLSLGADQEEKITLKAQQSAGTVLSLHLDEIRSLADQQQLVDNLKLLTKQSNTSVLLFSSPQAILNKKFLWMTFIDWLIVNERLSMVCVDEVHLFVHFGMTFRDEFKNLTSHLFDKLKLVGNTTTTKIPILFMTGTCTKTIVETIEKITGLLFDKQKNIYWPSALEMSHRHVFLDVAYTTKALSLFKKKVGPLLKETSLHKYIIYTNTRLTVERITPKICDWIDFHGFKADVLQIIGTLRREQKFYHIRVFTKSNSDNVELLKTCSEDNRPFNPQILTATSGAANAGIDDPDVYGVTRMEFPPSLLDVQQEKGRAGRRLSACSDTDWYLLCFSLESYVVLLQRLHNNPATNKDTSYFDTLETDMQECLMSFTIPQDCLHSKLEIKMANPYLNDAPVPTPCMSACAYCLGSYKSLFPSIIKSGVETVILQLFTGPNFMKTPTILDKDLVDAIKKYPGSNRLIFGKKTTKKPEPILIKKLIMMLLGAKLIRYFPERKETTPGVFQVTIYGSLAFVEGDPTKLAINEPSYWAQLPLKH
jgi:superfamily II DNA helicase RecQ